MASQIKKIIQRLFALVGLRVTPIGAGILARSKSILAEKHRYKWLQGTNIRTIIDVGANVGQSAVEFRKIFPNAMIYSFEPLRDCFEQMNANLKNVQNFRSFNLALGDKKGRATINRSSFCESSSIRKMAKLHREAFPETAKETPEVVNIDTIDNVAQEIDLQGDILLKIDVQGYEDKVIAGSESILGRVRVIIVETSFRELYEGQPLFAEVCELLHERGFAYAGSWSADTLDRRNGDHLFQDSIFVSGRTFQENERQIPISAGER